MSGFAALFSGHRKCISKEAALFSGRLKLLASGAIDFDWFRGQQAAYAGGRAEPRKRGNARSRDIALPLPVPIYSFVAT